MKRQNKQKAKAGKKRGGEREGEDGDQKKVFESGF